eukprot:scaffold942_cov260-Pinguiococcus_pyrenoidosus.AAC.20
MGEFSRDSPEFRAAYGNTNPLYAHDLGSCGLTRERRRRNGARRDPAGADGDQPDGPHGAAGRCRRVGHGSAAFRNQRDQPRCAHFRNDGQTGRRRTAPPGEGPECGGGEESSDLGVRRCAKDAVQSPQCVGDLCPPLTSAGTRRDFCLTRGAHEARQRVRRRAHRHGEPGRRSQKADDSSCRGRPCLCRSLLCLLMALRQDLTKPPHRCTIGRGGGNKCSRRCSGEGA